MTTPTASSGAAFSTRFLPSDGIPEYNALLDSHLGKRREYLLGNQKSLELLQQTGVISRVQAQQDNPNQYVVYMIEKPIHRRKRLPPRLALSGSSSNQGSGGAFPSERPPPWHQSGHQYPSSSGLKKSETTPHLMPYRYRNERLGRLRDDDDESDRDEDDESEQDDVSTSMAFKHRSSGSETKPSATALIQKPSNSTTNLNSVNAGGGGGGGGSSVSSKFAMIKSLGRSLSTTALTKRNVGLGGKSDPSSSMDRAKTKKVNTSEREPEFFPGFSKDPEYDNHDRLRSESLAATTANQFRLRSKSVVAAPIQGLPPQFESRGDGNEANQQNSQPQQHQQTKKAPLKGTVEHLLESDASYMAQIRVMKDQLADLDYEKGRLDAEVAQIRKRLRGVNAVHENDVAVAHCSSIMQHRLSKAEEEYMKLLTAQLQVRKDVDRVRREILSLKKVRKKLEADINDVRHMNALIEDKIRASKMTRNVVSAELVELEKKAEFAIEEQRLNLPPEEGVVVDIEKLMSAIQERNSNRRSSRHASVLWASGTPHGSASQLGSPGGGGANRPSMDTSASSAKPRLAYQAAFQVIQNSLGCKDLTSFIESFVEIEEQLLSKYKATLALEEEAVALQKDVQKLMKETASRHASIRGSYQASAMLHDEMQSKIRTLLSKIDSYNDLRETRNQEHTRVRIIMQRCLEVLQAEKLLSGQESIGGPMLMSELPSPALLEALQKRMTEVAMIMKMKHSAKIIKGPKNCFQAGRDAGAHRSNMFSTREVSKIVLGPREPAGSALAAILGSAQAPSVETALALTEKNSMESNHTAICAADAVAANARRSTKMSGGSSSKLGRGYEDIDNDAGPSSHPTIENTRRRSSRVSVAFPVGKKLDKLYDDEVITGADVEEDGA